MKLVMTKANKPAMGKAVGTALTTVIVESVSIKLLGTGTRVQ